MSMINVASSRKIKKSRNIGNEILANVPQRKVAKLEHIVDLLDNAKSLSLNCFRCHFDATLTEDKLKSLSDELANGSSRLHTSVVMNDFDGLKGCKIGQFRGCTQPVALEKKYVLKDVHKILIKNVVFAVNSQPDNVSADTSSSDEGILGVLSPFQIDLMRILCNYQDLLYPLRPPATMWSEMMVPLCLHVLNHVLNSRSQILTNNERLKMATHEGIEVDCKDQGFTRPKVLILVPFRQSAYFIIDTMIKLLFGDGRSHVEHKERFMKTYGYAREAHPLATKKPQDYQERFAGNTGDDFRMGIKIAKKTLKLFVDFYMADIIIASPLSLRVALGSEEEKDGDYDFLSSIEILIMDQSEVFLMQNWSHVLYILDHLNLQPKSSHGVDFSRIRVPALDGFQKHYRQTIIFSEFIAPEIRSVFGGPLCSNYKGGFLVQPSPCIGSVNQIFVDLPQAFQRFKCTDPLDEPELRFRHFVDKVFPEYKDSISMKQTLIFVPSYFDFVRLRNYFKREDISFVQICEYTKNKKISRARDMFFHEHKTFILYTERFHFYRRYLLKGVKHLLFFQLPTFPQFYSELCNFVLKSGSTDCPTCTVLYSPLDALRLARVVGTERAGKMLKSDKAFHLLVSGASGY